jgi:hypothetical protein
MTDHVHVQDAMPMQTVYNGLWCHTDSRDEELGAAVDDDADEFVKLALSVVVAFYFC